MNNLLFNCMNENTIKEFETPEEIYLVEVLKNPGLLVQLKKFGMKNSEILDYFKNHIEKEEMKKDEIINLIVILEKLGFEGERIVEEHASKKTKKKLMEIILSNDYEKIKKNRSSFHVW